MSFSRRPPRPPIDPVRMRQALDLHVTGGADPDHFHVQGPLGDDEWVEIRPDLICHCNDALDRDLVCAHLAAALLADGDAEAVRVARDIQHTARLDAELLRDHE